MKDDARLLHEFADDGSEAAFAELVRRHLDLVHSAARRQVAGDIHRAEEVTQAVFVELARQAKRLTAHRSLAGWLYTTARFVAARNQRAEQRRMQRETAVHSMNETDSESTLAWDDLRPLLDDVMHRLSPTDREAVVLRFFQNRPLAQVGHALGVGENAARMRVDRALERLRRELTRRGIRSTAAALSAALSAHAVAPAPAGLAATVGAASATVPLISLGKLGFLSELTVALMTTKKWLALGTVVVAGAFVGPRLLPPSPPPSPDWQAEFTEPLPPAGPPPGIDLAAGFRWNDIEAADYRQFIANLRASGAPERLIRDVVALEILGAYAPRYREVAGPVPQRAYWQKALDRGPTAEQQRRYTKFAAEMAAILRGLFGSGVSADVPFHVLYAQPDWDSVRLAWLPPGIAAQVQATLESLPQEPAEQWADEARENRERLLQRRMEALQSVLNPAQLREYRHRNSEAHTGLKSQLRYWDPTEEEFQRLAEQRDPFIYRPPVRMEDLREREAKAQTLFGRERALSFLRATDLSYGYAMVVARQTGLSPAIADQVWEIKRATLADDERLRLRSGLPPDQLQRERAALVQRTAAELTALVGENGLRYLQQDWPWWQALEKP